MHCIRADARMRQTVKNVTGRERDARGPDRDVFFACAEDQLSVKVLSVSAVLVMHLFSWPTVT